MTTQSLRGLPDQGPLHWRGDKTNVADEFDDTTNFAGFSPAFVGLLGRSTEPDPCDCDDTFGAAPGECVADVEQGTCDWE